MENKDMDKDEAMKIIRKDKVQELMNQCCEALAIVRRGEELAGGIGPEEFDEMLNETCIKYAVLYSDMDKKELQVRMLKNMLE